MKSLNIWSLIKSVVKSTWIFVQVGALAVTSVCIVWVICTVMPSSWTRDVAVSIIALVTIVYMIKIAIGEMSSLSIFKKRGTN